MTDVDSGVEMYHDLERFQEAGFGPMLIHTLEYFAGNRTVPVSRTTSFNNDRPILFTLSDDLMEDFVKEEGRARKAYEVALKYGFRGYSKGNQNGIFLQRTDEKKIHQQTNRLIAENLADVFDDLDIEETSLDKIAKVKVVFHDPSGERQVGVYNTQNDRIILLGFANY